jgi:pimeloyl-ACP methyl ester carboxylesterase
LLHGKSFTADTWRGLGTLLQLGKDDWRVTAVDLPSADVLPPDDFFLQFMDAAGIAKALVVSPSFSGWYAFPFITTYPERVTGFVGVAPRGIRTHRDRLHRISAPVLAVWGEHDDVIPLARADLLLAEVPNGRKIVMPGGTHAPYMSDPNGFHEHLLSFGRECR